MKKCGNGYGSAAVVREYRRRLPDNARDLVAASLGEVDQIFDYLAEFNPRAALDVATALIEAGDSLADFPYRGRAVPNTGRREIVTVYPYIIRYRVSRDAVRILRVRHTARRPTKR